MPRLYKVGGSAIRRRRRASRLIQRKWRRYKSRKRYSLAAVKYKVKRLQRQVNKDIEHRWSDDGNFVFQIPAAGGSVTTVGLDLIAQGDNTNNRTGNKINLKGLHLKGQMIVADSHNFVRIMLVQVLSLNQIVIVSDVLQPDATTGNPTIYSPYRKESRLKFKVLLDKFYKLQTVAAGSVYPFLVNVDMSYKWPKGLTVTYNDPAQNTPIYNNIMVLAISDSQLATHPTFRGFRRTTWIA